MLVASALLLVTVPPPTFLTWQASEAKARVASDGSRDFVKLNAETAVSTPRKPATVLAGAPKGTTAMSGNAGASSFAEAN